LFAQKGDTEGDDKVYLRVDHMPYYLYGGSEENYAKDVEAIMKFISDNIRYPKDAWKIEKQGKVICRFVVEKDGRLSDIHILEGDSLYPSLDKEAIRVISSFPKWHPGTMGKKAVRTGFSLPVIFRMRGAKVQE
jgi:TonB family protein